MALQLSRQVESGGARLPREPFRSAHALDLGITRWMLAELVASGEVRRVLTDVYVDGRIADTLELRAEAARLVLPPHAVVVDRSAAWLWGVDLRERSELDSPPRLEVFVPPGHKRITRPQAGGGERDLAPRDVCLLGGLQVTTRRRTAMDLARGLRPYEALAALDAFARLHGLSPSDLTVQLPRFRGRRGVVQARRLIPLMDGRAESTGESFTRLAIIDALLPQPTLQHWVVEGGVPRYRLDLAYPELRICVEYDGVQYHSSEERRYADRQRRTWLRERGWIVIVVTKDSFAGAALDGWLDELRSALRARGR